LSLSSGLRAGEIFNLTYKDIDLENRIIYIRNPKNGEDRAIYITNDVYDILKERQGNPDELIFKDKNGNKIERVSRTFFRIIDELGLNNGKDRKNKAVFHTLRHTFASWLAVNGTPIFTIKELLGHKNSTMTERYSHLLPGIKQNAVSRLEKMFKKKGNIISVEV